MLPCAPHPSHPPFPHHSPGMVALCRLPLLCKVGLALAFPCPSPAPEDGAVEVTVVVVAAAAVVEDNILLPVCGLRLERSESELQSGRRRGRGEQRHPDGAAPPHSGQQGQQEPCEARGGPLCCRAGSAPQEAGVGQQRRGTGFPLSCRGGPASPVVLATWKPASLSRCGGIMQRRWTSLTSKALG